jgi:hypothetical protein
MISFNSHSGASRGQYYAKGLKGRYVGCTLQEYTGLILLSMCAH